MQAGALFQHLAVLLPPFFSLFHFISFVVFLLRSKALNTVSKTVPFKLNELQNVIANKLIGLSLLQRMCFLSLILYNQK